MNNNTYPEFYTANSQRSWKEELAVALVALLAVAVTIALVGIAFS